MRAFYQGVGGDNFRTFRSVYYNKETKMSCALPNRLVFYSELSSVKLYIITRPMSPTPLHQTLLNLEGLNNRSYSLT